MSDARQRIVVRQEWIKEAERAASNAWSDMGVAFVEGKRTSLPDWGHFAAAFIAGYLAAKEPA
jgi:hypothetical protein